MCSHINSKTINDVKVCFDCGLTIMPDGKIMFDKNIIKYKNKNKNKKGVKK